jgi:hypothetical protein
MQRLEVRGAVRPLYMSLGVKGLIIVQQDATQSSLFIIMQVHSTCFGCQTHPSSGIHKTVTTATGTVQLPPSNEMQHKAVYLLLCKFTLHVSGVKHTHLQEYTKL